MNHIIITFIALMALASPATAQEYRYNPMLGQSIPVIDLSADTSLSFVVSRNDRYATLFPSVAKLSNGRLSMIACYLTVDSLSRIEMKTTDDGGRTWSTPFTSNTLKSNDSSRALSMFSVAKSNFSSAKNHSGTGTYSKNNLIMFLGKQPMDATVSTNDGETWGEIFTVNNFGGYKVTSMIQLKDGRYMAVFHDDGRFLSHDPSTLRKSVVYKMYSYDGGFTWTKPKVALKHNIYGLYDACMMRVHTSKGNRLMMIASERKQRTAVISYSDDEGETWSYPRDLPAFLHGDRFNISYYKNRLLIVYRDMFGCNNREIANSTFGDLVMWVGKPDQLDNEGHGSFKVRIADNYPRQDEDRLDLRVSDCGYPTINHLIKNDFSIVAFGRWEPDAPPYVKNFILNLDILDHIYKKYKNTLK